MAGSRHQGQGWDFAGPAAIGAVFGAAVARVEKWGPTRYCRSHQRTSTRLPTTASIALAVGVVSLGSMLLMQYSALEQPAITQILDRQEGVKIMMIRPGWPYVGG